MSLAMDAAHRASYLYSMSLIRSLTMRVMILLALVAGMSTLGIAHQSHAVSLTPQMIGYIQAGGALSDVCGETGGPMRHASCEACRIGSSMDDGVGVAPLQIVPVWSADAPSLPGSVLATASIQTGFTARGPPTLS